jgi:hypothetical protein
MPIILKATIIKTSAQFYLFCPSRLMHIKAGNPDLYNFHNAMPPSFQTESFDQNNPDHTGYPCPGLFQAVPAHQLSSAARSASKTVFYRFLKMRKFPIKYLKNIQKSKTRSDPYTVVPAELSRHEGKEANMLRFKSWLRHVSHWSDILYTDMNNLHVYTADCYEELAWDVSFEEILSGKYGRMDKRYPLRVVFIPGKAEPRGFPYEAFISRGLRELMKCDGSTLEEESSDSISTQNRERVISPPEYIDEAPPSYEEAMER